MVQFHHCPAAVSGDEISMETTVHKDVDGKGGESRKIHESENLASGLKTFRGEGGWLKGFL